MQFLAKNLGKQLCILVGCILPACWPYRGVLNCGGVCRPSSPVNRMTDRYKNITLPQTSFAGGINRCLPQTQRLTLLSGKYWIRHCPPPRPTHSGMPIIRLLLFGTVSVTAASSWSRYSVISLSFHPVLSRWLLRLSLTSIVMYC